MLLLKLTVDLSGINNINLSKVKQFNQPGDRFNSIQNSVSNCFPTPGFKDIKVFKDLKAGSGKVLLYQFTKVFGKKKGLARGPFPILNISWLFLHNLLDIDVLSTIRDNKDVDTCWLGFQRNVVSCIVNNYIT